MQNIWGLHWKGLAKRRKEQILLSESTHKQVLTVKKSMQLILHSSTRALITVAISSAPDGGFNLESMCMQTKSAHRDVPHRMLREVKVQMARWYFGGNPILHTSA